MKMKRCLLTCSIDPTWSYSHVIRSLCQDCVKNFFLFLSEIKNKNKKLYYNLYTTSTNCKAWDWGIYLCVPSAPSFPVKVRLSLGMARRRSLFFCIYSVHWLVVTTCPIWGRTGNGFVDIERDNCINISVFFVWWEEQHKLSWRMSWQNGRD